MKQLYFLIPVVLILLVGCRPDSKTLAMALSETRTELALAKATATDLKQSAKVLKEKTVRIGKTVIQIKEDTKSVQTNLKVLADPKDPADAGEKDQKIILASTEILTKRIEDNVNSVEMEVKEIGEVAVVMGTGAGSIEKKADDASKALDKAAKAAAGLKDKETTMDKALRMAMYASIVIGVIAAVVLVFKFGLYRPVNALMLRWGKGINKKAQRQAELDMKAAAGEQPLEVAIASRRTADPHYDAAWRELGRSKPELARKASARREGLMVSAVESKSK